MDSSDAASNFLDADFDDALIVTRWITLRRE